MIASSPITAFIASLACTPPGVLRDICDFADELFREWIVSNPAINSREDQSLKLASSRKSEASEIMLQTS